MVRMRGRREGGREGGSGKGACLWWLCVNVFIESAGEFRFGGLAALSGYGGGREGGREARGIFRCTRLAGKLVQKEQASREIWTAGGVSCEPFVTWPVVISLLCI